MHYCCNPIKIPPADVQKIEFLHFSTSQVNKCYMNRVNAYASTRFLSTREKMKTSWLNEPTRVVADGNLSVLFLTISTPTLLPSILLFLSLHKCTNLFSVVPLSHHVVDRNLHFARFTFVLLYLHLL